MSAKSPWAYFSLQNSFFFLPVFFLALSISPNLIVSKLTTVLWIAHFVVYPAASALYRIFSDRAQESANNSFRFPKYIIGLTILLIGVALWNGLMKLNLSFILLMMVYLLGTCLAGFRKQKMGLSFLQGFLMVVMLYVGLNNFSISQAVNSKLLAAAGLVGSLFLFVEFYYMSKSEPRFRPLWTLLVFAATITGFNVYVAMNFGASYLWYFDLAIVPTVIYIMYHLGYAKASSNPKLHWLKLILSAPLLIFFIYLFVDFTGVANTF